MLKWWNHKSFTAKLMIVNSISIFLAVLLIMFTQVEMFVSASEKESVKNLDLLTDQIALNFKENQQNIEEGIYARLTTFAIPSMMKRYTGESRELKYSLEQMITHSTDYNYIMLEMNDGSRIDSSSKYMIAVQNLSVIRDNSNEILDTYTENTHGSNLWMRYDDGDVYILKDIYDVNPLRHVGRMVVHMKAEPYEISQLYSDLMFLFFDKEGNYLTKAGETLMPDAQLQVADFVEGDKTLSGLYVGKEKFLVAKYARDGWLTVGILSMETYRETESRIIERSILYGIIAFGIGTVMAQILLNAVVRKLKQLQKAMDEVANGGLGYQMPVDGDDDISQLGLTFNYMINRIDELLEELIQKERAKKDIEIEMLEYKYRSLQSQIRPHFIYNALESVSALAKMRRYQEVEESIQRISRYFRNITVNDRKQFVTVEQELNSLRDYTEIYRFVYGEKLQVVYAAREAAKNAMIPTMIVQPLVENALKYGIRDREEFSEVRIHAYKQSDKLCITIKDSGSGLSSEVAQAVSENKKIPSTEKSGIGLSNVKERLRLIYGDTAEFYIGNRKEGGVCVKIVIPLHYGETEMEGTDILEELEELGD